MAEGDPPGLAARLGDLAEELPASGERCDRIILDMLAPWECLDAAADALRPGGIVCAYVATTTQLSRFMETVRLQGGFTEPQAWESLVRDWHVEGLAVRPGPQDDRPHRLPGDRPPDGTGGEGPAQEAPPRTGRLRPRLHRAPSSRRPRRVRDAG